MNAAGGLPDFLILGAAKAGTTALYGALSRHPLVYCSAEKEPRFFEHAGSPPRFRDPAGEASARRVVSDEAAYRALFADCPPGRLAGEASTEYLSGQRAPAVAFRYVPQARLIAILRHPVERAYSQYLFLRHEGAEPLATFEAAWAAEEERIAGGWRPATHYRARGFYGRALGHWLDVFPREQLLVLFHEDWLGRPEHTLGLVCRHLGIEPLVRPAIRRENVSSRQPRWAWLHHRMVEDNGLRRWAQRRLPLALRDVITRSITGLNLKRGPRLDPALRARLAVVYHDDLKQVEALTGRGLAAWRS
jgi:hypothetical protein